MKYSIASRLSSEVWLPWMYGLVTPLPLLWCHSEFADLWWFGDDWDLLDQISRNGFLAWTVQVFAENFVPLFKVLWGGMVFLFEGSHFAMIVALWITHAVNVVLLARLLRAVGFSWSATTLCAAIFGLTADNLETLAWSVQWSAILATTFFLLATTWLQRHQLETRAWDWRLHLPMLAFVTASALSFSRGVLTGLVLATVSMIPLSRGTSRWGQRFLCVAICTIPALSIAALILAYAPGNHHDFAAGPAIWLKAAEFGTCYFAIAPWHRLLELDSWGPRTTAAAAAIKLTVFAFGFYYASPTQRKLLLTMLLFDLASAALLGIGRHHTGLISTNGSRYHYNPLLCTLPFVACVVDRWLSLILVHRIRIATAALLIVASAYGVSREWRSVTEEFASWRGRNTRQLLLEDPNPPTTGAIPGIEFMPTARAKQLIADYNLH